MEDHKRDKYASPDNKGAKQKTSPGKKHIDRRSWKLIADPALGRGQEKVYRFDGILPGNPVPVLTRDPRFRINRLKLKDEPMDLPLPNLKLDEHFVGKLPPRDVTFSGLNDNINEAFLTDMCRPFGDIEALEIFTHPRSGRHLGIGRVLYCSVKSARICVERLNNTLKMGKVIQVFLDVGGKARVKLIDEQVNEVKPAAPVLNEHAEADLGKDVKISEVKSDDRLSKGQDSESSSRRRQAELSSKSVAGHNSLSRWQSSPPHQQITSRHGEVVVNTAQPVLYPPPPSLVGRPSTGSHIVPSQTDADLFATSEAEYVINSGSSPQILDKEEGEIGSEDSESTESSEDEEGEEAESLEQRIQALLTGKDPKSKDKEAKTTTSSAAPTSRIDSSRPVVDIKQSKLSSTSAENATFMPPMVPSTPVIEPIMPFPFSMPPPPFALPPGIRPPPSAIFVTKDQQGALFTSTFELLIAELRRTLYRDLCRRLLEQCAFRHLDSWWLKNEIRSRAAKKPAEEPSNSQQSSQQPPASEQKQSQNETQSSVLSNGAVENDGWEKIFRQGGVFGLRDTLPKLPSFRRKDVQLAPPRSQIISVDNAAPSSHREHLRKISESASDNSVADFPVSPKHNDSNSAAEDQQRRRQTADSKKRKTILSDSDIDSDEETKSSSESSSSLDDFTTSSSESSEEEEESSESSSADQANDTDRKSDVTMKSPKNTVEASRSPQEDADANLGVANRPVTPANAVKALSSPVTSPQKPKARWAMFLQEQEHQQPTIPPVNNNADNINNNTSSSQVEAAIPAHQNLIKEPELRQEKQPEKQSRAEKGKLKTTQSKNKTTSKNKPAQRGRKKSLAEVVTSESSGSELSSAETDEETETDSKPKSKKKTPVHTKKVTPARRNTTSKGRQGSAKSVTKEPLQQQQQQKAIKPATPAQQQPASPRKPVVKRVNTLTNTVKEETVPVDDDSQKCEIDSEVRDPRIPDFLIDHCYVPLLQLQQLTTPQPKSIEPAPVIKPAIVFKPRDRDQEEAVATSFMRFGIDAEDLQYLERSYEELLQNYSQSYYWLNETHWVKHPPTVLSANAIAENEGSPRKKRRTAVGGCARCDLVWRGGKVARPHGPAGTETVEVCETAVSQGGIDLVRVSESGAVFSGSVSLPCPGSGASTSNALERLGADIGRTTKAAKAELREARSHQRRLLACYSSGLPEEKRDILGFNLLKYRKKRVRFARSGIHGWGLYALEPIAAEEMVVEYAGELVRKTVGDLREKKYARLGVDGSYMFRVDEDLIVDATMAGNYGRFINHSCAPNCYAKVITVDGRKKIVIYSKREIAVSEEITYDYKFPLEPAANKITCHCAASTCRQTLN